MKRKLKASTRFQQVLEEVSRLIMAIFRILKLCCENLKKVSLYEIIKLNSRHQI